MTRSRKKTPITGNAGGSEKKDKQLAHRRWRKINKLRISLGLTPLMLKEVSNIWSFNKDGKHWLPKDIRERWMRK